MRLKEFTNNVANWRTIAARNNLANPDVIMPGQVLDIGDGVVMPKGTKYVVKSGDTLSGIAQNIRKGQVPDTASAAWRYPGLHPTNITLQL
jgi:nucleoid-associated protein YgaU